MTQQPGMNLEAEAQGLRELADEAEKSLGAETNPAARTALEDSIADIRALARRMEERAAVTDDEGALREWYDRLSPERLSELQHRLARLRGDVK